jgi:hypothetical protein
MIVHVHEALREEQVAQSNKIEGYDWTTEQVRDVVRRSEAVLNAPLRDLLDAVRGDPHAFEALGLFEAHRIAEDWAEHGVRPTEVEIRQLHQLITAGEPGAGQYRTKVGTEIKNQKHEPPHPLLVPQHMHDFSEWWKLDCPYPVLTATVAHAWLTHIHPFEDGNGRLARLLANLALIQSGYPPLIIRASERERYYDALAASDDGDILPLFALFAKMEERVAARMEKDSYIQALVEREFLATTADRFMHWKDVFRRFRDEFRVRLDEAGWGFTPQGFLEVEEFDLLSNRDPAGNAWWAKISSGPAASAEWLGWFGYCSNELVDVLGKPSGYPSVFLSPRNTDPESPYPYRSRLGDPLDEFLVPHEFSVLPGAMSHVLIRTSTVVDDVSVSEAARILAQALVEEGPLD